MKEKTENKELEKEEEGIKQADKNNKSIRLYWWGDKVMCDAHGKTYWTPQGYIRGLLFKSRKFCYLTEWYTEEQRKVYLENKNAEFKQRVKQSLKSSNRFLRKVHHGL